MKNSEEKIWCPRCRKEVVPRREAFPRLVAAAGVAWVIALFLLWYATGDAVITAAGGIFLLLAVAAVVIAFGAGLPKSCPECGMPESEMRKAAAAAKPHLEKKRKN